MKATEGLVETSAVLQHNPHIERIQRELRLKAQHEAELRGEVKDSGSIPTPSDQFVAATSSVPMTPAFRWKKDGDGRFVPDPPRLAPKMDVQTMRDDAKGILRALGIKIELQMAPIKESFMRYVVQSRSPNFLMAKFGQFKVGLYGYLLTLLGMSPTHLLTLKKGALQNAIRDNKTAMSETIYQQEVLYLLYGSHKKARRNRRMYSETQKQLAQQMNQFGQIGYWNEERLTEERQAQCARIKEEYEREMESMEYQLAYLSVVGR